MRLVASAGDGAPGGALGRIRSAAAVVFILLSAALVLNAIAGRPTSEVLAGSVFGTMLALIGIEAIAAVAKR